jgi:hypothetical protein
MQLALDTSTWDLELDSSGNIATLSDPAALLSQRIQCRLQTFRGECFLDRSIGVPYFSEVTRKNPDLARVRSLLASVVAGVEGVSKVLSLELLFESARRHLSVTFRVLGSSGEIATGEV